jgi:hypothetical protein
MHESSRHTLGFLIVAYENSLILLLLIYLRITIFLHRQTSNQTLVVKQHQQRDLLVVRRILLTVGLLMVFGILAVILLIMLYITGEENPLIFRIEWLFVSLSLLFAVVLSILMLMTLFVVYLVSFLYCEKKRFLFYLLTLKYEFNQKFLAELK